MERDVLVLRGHGDPVALVVPDFEAELLRVPLGRFLRVGDDEGDRGKAYHGDGIRSRAIKTADRGKAHVPFLAVPDMAPWRRLELAKALANVLKERQGRNLIADGAYGSVCRAVERAHSVVAVLV